MKQKITDTSAEISAGGRLKRHWQGKTPKQKRSFFVSFKEEEFDMKAILNEFSLKGFEFGRWVNNEDRYDFVIGTKESMEDLSKLLKSKNLGINHNIGVAFGARGQGGNALAHYEPVYNMINLTKPNGSGTLAHEYGHALDYNIGQYVDQNKKHAALSGGRSMSKFPVDNTGGTVRLLMRKLIYEIKSTLSYGRTKDMSDYWKYNTEVFARFFEQWCCYKLKESGKRNTFLTSTWNEYVSSRVYLTEGDFKKVLPTADKLMKNIGLTLEGKPVEKYMELEIVNPEMVAESKEESKQKKSAAPKQPGNAKKVSVKSTPKKVSAKLA